MFLLSSAIAADPTGTKLGGVRLKRGSVVLLACACLGACGLALIAGAAPAGASGTPPFVGNPAGNVPVPAAGRAVASSHFAHVIGSGTPAACTSAAVVRAVARGGAISFDCGPKPLTIVMRATADVTKTSHRMVLDGGGLITLSGAGRRRILYSDTCAGRPSTDDCYDQPYPQVVVENIAFANGYAATRQAPGCNSNSPACSYGGGAIFLEGGQFKAVNSRFVDNRCYAYGPDLGGGAIRVLAQYRNRPVYITGDDFSGGRCSNGAALSSISVQWDVFNSQFTGNRAIGWGANPAANGTPGGGSGGAIYMDGTDDNALIAATVMRDNTAREGGGAVFDVVDSGYGSLTFRDSHLLGNTSGEFQTAPGVYYDLDGHDSKPVLIGSSDS
jgi:hypothetical protein